MICTVLMLCGCVEQVNFQTGLNHADANEIVMLLDSKGIEVNKMTAKDGVTLVINKPELARATKILEDAGLPRKNQATLGQVFKKEGMISTPLEERARYIYALSQELEYTLQKQFDRVISARVLVVLPERVAPGEPIQPSSASVAIKYRPPFDEDAVLPQVRNLVAASIPGLSGEEGRQKVSVMLTSGEVTDTGVDWIMVGPFKVEASSAGGLKNTLIGLVLFSIFNLLLFAGMLALRSERFGTLIKERFPKLAVLAGG